MSEPSVRSVEGTVLHPTGEPWAGALLVFTLTGTGMASGNLFPDGQTRVTTEADGTFAINLWVNAGSEIPVTYTVMLPSRRQIEFTLPVGETAINLTEILNG